MSWAVSGLISVIITITQGTRAWHEIRKLTSALDVNEVHVVRRRVNYSPEEHAVRHLAMEPDVLVGRESPGQFRPDNPDDVPQHGNEDETTIEGKDQSSASRAPDGPLEGVETGELSVCRLAVFIRVGDERARAAART